MHANWPVFMVAIVYMLVLAAISFYVRRYSRNAEGFTTGGRSFPAMLVGFLMMSEFIGTTASVGTAQAAYEDGLSAAWNLAALGIGFVIFSFLLAGKYKAWGENTISGALRKTYGERVKFATSIIMICALSIVAISVYASGGAVLSGLLGIDRDLAIVITGAIAVLYVALGGMRSVVYTNFLHALTMYVGILLVAGFGVSQAGGVDTFIHNMTPAQRSVDNVGWAQIFAWLIAGIGATFATQYIVQAITTVTNEREAKKASFFCATMLIPYGVLAAVVGVASAMVYPDIASIQALPVMLQNMNDFTAGIVVAGLTGALFGTIAALTMGISTLALKDFYQPFFNREDDDRKNLIFLRSATILAGLIPVVFAIFASDVLVVTFLAKALRASLAVLVIIMFYAPRFGTHGSAFWSIIASLVITLSWFLMGNPLGIDNAYVAVVTPLVIMTIGHFIERSRRDSRKPLSVN